MRWRSWRRSTVRRRSASTSARSPGATPVPSVRSPWRSPAGRLDGVRVGGPADAADGIGLFGGAAPDVLFLLVHLLLASGYEGPWHLGVAPDVDDEDGWDRARGLVRAGRVLAAKARRSQDDPTIKDALADSGADALGDETVGPYTAAAARALVADRAGPVLADAGPTRAELDRLVTDVVLGLR